MFPVYAFPPALAGAVILALAVVSLTHRRPDRLSVAFAVFCFSWAGVAGLNVALQLTGSVALARVVPGSVWLTYSAMAVYIVVLGGYDQRRRTPVFGLRPDVWVAGTFAMAVGFGVAAARSDLLVSGMLHDPRFTPLGAVKSAKDTSLKAARGLLTHAQGGLEPKRIALLGKVIDDSASVLDQGLERIDGIVRRLRTFVRLDESEVLQVDLAVGLDAALGLLAHELTGVAVTRRYAATRKVTCRAREVNQALFNVLTNAAQATAAGGQVEVATEDTEAGVRVTVRDDGPGIPPEHLPRIFDPGFTTRGVGVGTGMGLAVTQRVIQDHQGDVQVESVVGGGTTVQITLPVNAC